MTTTTKRSVGRPRKDQPVKPAYIEVDEVDVILNQLTLIINSAKETRNGVNAVADIVLQQQAEPGTGEAVMLYQNKQEVYFTKLHADACVESLEYMKQRFLTMRRLFVAEAELRKEMEKEIFKLTKKK